MKQGVFARLGLGFAYALQGNTAQSRAVDQVFSKWGTTLIEAFRSFVAAKSEYARLK